MSTPTSRSEDFDIDVHAPLQALFPQLKEIDTAVIFTHLPRLFARLKHLKDVFEPSVQHSIAIKSHPHIEQLRVICERGFGLEAASIEEVRRALVAGCPPERLVFDSPVKTRREIIEVSQLPGILVNVNSLSELTRIPEDAECMVGIRINPEIHTGSPELFSVGRSTVYRALQRAGASQRRAARPKRQAQASSSCPPSGSTTTSSSSSP